MSYTYAKRNQSEQAEKPEKAPQTAETAQSVAAARSSALADAHRVDLPDAMRSKMESAFGADFSAVKLYESQSVADAGAEAVTQGSSIAFAPGKLDFASAGGQSLLGHELSHVVSQQRGEVTGSGFLSDRALEARADREGAMAAAGQQVYAGPVTGAMSSAAPSAATAGPMQAKRNKGGGKDAFSWNPWKRNKQLKNAINQMKNAQMVQNSVWQRDREAGKNDPEYEDTWI